MKQIFKFFGIAIMATFIGLSFVSCSDDESTNNSQNQNQNQNSVNLNGFNLAHSYGFTITTCYCCEFTAEENSFVLQHIADGTLYASWFYAPSDEDNYYIGTELNLVSGSSSEAGFTVDKYDVATQKLMLCSHDEQTSYSGTVVLTQDKDKVYMSWTGESIFPSMFEAAKLEGYVLKSKL